MDTNIAVRMGWISCAGASAAVKGRNTAITMKPTGCIFSITTITDSTNKITYTIKICIVDIHPQYLEMIQTSYLLSVTKTLRRCAIQVMGLGKELLVNPRQENRTEAILKDQESYSCSFDHTLVLSVGEESILPDSGTCTIILKVGAASIPLQIKDESSRATELTGLGVLRWKYKETKRLEYRDGKLVAGTTAFYTKKGGFQDALELESWILKHQALAVDLTIRGPVEHPIQVSDAVRDAYTALLQKIEARRQLPSLVQYTDEIKDAAEAYVEAVKKEFAAIPKGESLKAAQSDLLLIGCVMQTYDDYMIRMSPLHPMNIQYQLSLLEQEDVGCARDQILEKLTPLNLLPYVRDQERNLYHAVEQKYAPEWRFYAQVSNKRYQGTRRFIQKLVAGKISQYKDNFPFLFDDIDNTQFYINLVNMGDCKEVFQGLIRYYAQLLAANIPSEKLDRFTINIYGDRSSYNEFSALGNHNKLREFVQDSDCGVEDLNEMSLILASNIKCFFCNLNSEEYQYAHLTFYEMNSSNDYVTGRMENIPTGISLNGLTSGVPSVLDGSWYKTGFGMRFAAKDNLTDMAVYYNALYHVAFSGSSYDPDVCTFTEIEKEQEGLLKKIYQASNWVVFVSPKVDLSFFRKKSSDESELMIIHYSDQYTSSNGYDDITVTQKSAQYREIIREQLQKKNVTANSADIDGVINMFNAINGSWMLKLISAKKMAGALDSYFSREKMSILSAIKLCMAYYARDGIIWVPISLEEILRVSGAAGLSQNDGLLSAKNLGFPQRPTSDDILLVGIEGKPGAIRIYLHPIEVKIGQNTSVYGKARQQVLSTYDGFWNALWPDEGRDNLEHKVTRSFFMQLVLVCCEKMKLYGICPAMPWNHVLNDCRAALLNEEYTCSRALDTYIGKGTIVSFKSDILTPGETENEGVTLLEFPEKAGADYMVRPISEIVTLLEDLHLPRQMKEYRSMECVVGSSEKSDAETVLPIVDSTIVHGGTPDLEPVEDKTVELERPDAAYNDSPLNNPMICPESPESEDISQAATSMEILFGTDLGTGQPLYWLPNDTEQVFHTNTGIIGTMGTGKTQFTKSMIAQLYKEQIHNFRGRPLGILIFDYKGDYNESKADFVQMTNARILKPYQLPFNPLAITKSRVFRPLLPVHTANAFKDTLSKVYGLGAKQQNSLLSCIMEAYSARGIFKDKPDTWERTPPTFESVYHVYAENDEIKKNDSLAAAMDKLHEFQVFEEDPEKTISLFDLLEGVVVVDLSGYDSDIQSLIVAITLDLFYSQMQAAGSSQMDHQYRELTKLILVDEADNFMSEGFPALKKILKEGREFGVGTILSTQFLKHFGSGEDDYIYYARGGGTATQRQDLFKEKLAINAQAKQIEDDLLNAAAGELPFCLIRDMLEEICVQAEKEHEQSVTRSALDKISFMSEQFLAFQQTDSASIQHFIDFMKCSAEKEYIEPIYKLTDQAWYQAKHLQKHQLKNARKRTANMMAQFQNLREQESKIDSYLSVDIDESTLTRIYKKIKALEQTEIDLSVQLEAKRKRRVSLHSEAIRTNTDYNRFAESVLKNLESSDDSNRIANYSQRAIRVLEKYRICLQKNKADLLAKTMTDCYKKIASKKNLIDRINMDPVSLDFQYINAEGEVVPKASLSAGEKQLMVISLLWSLAICSKWKLPVIIDTPLSRLDSIHRLALITSYFPHASDQTIILSTDSEINQYYYEAMKESVGDEFTLVYDEERKCSVIKKGYFVGAQLCL